MRRVIRSCEEYGRRKVLLFSWSILLLIALVSVSGSAKANAGRVGEIGALIETRYAAVMLIAHLLSGCDGYSSVSEGQQACDKYTRILKDSVAHEGFSSITPSVQRIYDLAGGLKQGSVDDDNVRSYTLTLLLDEYLRFDDAACGVMDRLRSSPISFQEQLADQVRDVGALLLAAHARSKRVLGIHSVALDDEGFRSIDLTILNRFAVMSSEHPEHARDLDRQLKRYRFVRNQLIGHGAAGIGSGSIYYVERMMIDLDSLLPD